MNKPVRKSATEKGLAILLLEYFHNPGKKEMITIMPPAITKIQSVNRALTGLCSLSGHNTMVPAKIIAKDTPNPTMK